MLRAAALTATDAAALYARCLPPGALPAANGSVAVGVRAGCASGTALAALLSSTGMKVFAVVGPPRGGTPEAPALQDPSAAELRTRHALEKHNVEAVSLQMGGTGWTSGDVVRGFARSAIVRGAKRLALPTSMVDAAAAGLVRLDGAVQVYDTEVPAAEMLPPGVLDVVRPFVAVDPETHDATVESLLGQDWLQADKERVPETSRARHELEIDVEDMLRYGNRRHAAMLDLRRASDALMRACVLDVSHWGYAVFCRESLSRAYNDTAGGGRMLAVHVLARLATHVCGNSRLVELDSKVLLPLAHELLHRPVDAHGRWQALAPAPKGRTLAGAVIRPANGSFLKRWRGAQRQRPFGGAQDDWARPEPPTTGRDVLIISREPDLETSRMVARRMSGNISSVPIPESGAGVYWDNRFVISATAVSDVREQLPVFSDQSILLAALSLPQAVDREALDNASFYVRQLRHADWETVTSVSRRVRWHNVPYQCVRGLPAIFQKKAGDSSPGVLAAAPHLGLSGRPDMVFTAVRMPRYRTLPSDLDPGFTVLADVEVAA